ncbi:Gfo/Idh/MocA family protein [Cryobacterium tagatosivorans]|uniref:Gfo/Idh/MocA family protein n=1 Tax=Cryobacterium tagatosivorans TaxID=1259199 RepID=UPI00141B1216|nr:Gfo/Idh/MocA family oxidoreductase [Cryobacterium tagatosivorans]
MTIGIAILGAGRIAHSHAQAIARSPHARLVAVADRDAATAEHFARAYGAPLHTTDIRRAIGALGVEAVIVCSPTTLHHNHAIAALEAGQHALVEKPFAVDVAEAAAMIGVAETSGLQLMSGQVLRFMPMFSFAKQFIEAGRLGSPVQSVERRLTFRRDQFPWWKDLPQFLVSHWGSHSLDILCHLLDDDVDQVLCSGSSVVSEFGVIDDFTLQARFRSGFRSAIAMSFTSRFPVHDIVLIGENATLQFDCYRRVTVDGEVVIERADQQMMDEGFDAQLRSFVGAIRGEHALESSGSSVLRSLAALAAAEASVSTGQPERLGTEPLAT